MALVHRNNDGRSCGATTVVAGQSFVYVDNELWAVDGDPNSHDDGNLIPGVVAAIYINGSRVIGVGDNASPDGLCAPVGGAHCAPAATGGDSLVTAV